jgi:diguanylate cyclase (GGDEF)-like protein/PAS domain S-box-containing protein
MHVPLKKTLSRRAANKALRDLQAGARTILDATHDAIVMVDASGTVTSANPAAERLYGWRADELVGRPWMTLRPRDESVDARELFLQTADLMLDSGTPADSTFQHRDGTPLAIEFSLARLDGGMVMVSRDVSGQREVADAVREQSQRIAALASAQSQIAAGGSSPHATMEIVAAAACRLVGASGAAIQVADGENLICRAGVGTTAHWVGARMPLVGSLSGTAYQTGQLAMLTDTGLTSEPLVARAETLDETIRTLLAVPLREGGTPTGVLMVAHSLESAFDERDLRMLELFSGMAASVLHRSQVEHSLEVTHAVAQAASVDATLESGLDGTLRVVTGRLGWEAAAIWLESDEVDLGLECKAHLIAAGLPAQQLQAAFSRTAGPADAAPVWTAFSTSAPLWQDVSREIVTGRISGSHAADGLTSAVYVPLLSHGRAIGVLELLQRRPRAHDAEELALLETIAAQVANFVARRQAEAHMGVQAEHLAGIVALSQMLAGVPVSHVRQALCEGIREMASCDVVALYEPDGEGAALVTAQAGDAPAPDTAVEIGGDSLIAETFRNAADRFVTGNELEALAQDELVARTGMRSGYLEPILRDGSVVAVLAIISRVPRARPTGGIGELAKLLAAEAATTLALADLVRALDARARTDELTGLPNRRTWDEELPKELARAKRAGRSIAVAMLDLDHFKKYNDSFGHPAGDRLLRAVAAGWTTRLRETDLLARYGGEEFAVVLPDCDGDSARQVLDELRLCMPDGATCSIGVAVWDGRESGEALLSRADQALYEAKRSGRDRITAAVTA